MEGVRVEPPTLYAQSLAHVICDALHGLPVLDGPPPPARFQAQLDQHTSQLQVREQRRREK